MQQIILIYNSAPSDNGIGSITESSKVEEAMKHWREIKSDSGSKLPRKLICEDQASFLTNFHTFSVTIVFRTSQR